MYSGKREIKPLPNRPPQASSSRPALPVVPEGELDHTQRNLLVHEGRVYVAFNTTDLPLVNPRVQKGSARPDPIKQELPSKNDKGVLKGWRRPEIHWASNQYPLSGWAPARPSFYGLLSRLYAPRDRFPVEKQGSFYYLCQSVRDSCTALEGQLITFVRLLFQILPTELDL